VTETAVESAARRQDRGTSVSTELSPVDSADAPRERPTRAADRGVTAANPLQDLTSATLTTPDRCHGNTGRRGRARIRRVHDLQ
jgi:hypothetical protein